jgi:1,4-dihydroxy-2-naphthoate octaprenyltransferase
MHPARNFFVHLRLPFQLMLAPFMLLGAALAHARLGVRFVLAFVVVHVCMYGGTTAFNSHYDRDEGPIGGLEKPPPVGPWLLPGSLVLQAIGLLVAFTIGLRFFVVCVLFGVLGVLYSHPIPRFKGKPLPSWFTIMFAQGGLGALAGAVVEPAAFTPELLWGLLAAAALVGGLYPISQVFQLEEDRARGDRTVALMLGRRGTPIAASALFIVGCACMIASASTVGRRIDTWLFGLAPIPMALGAFWACRDSREAFRRVMIYQVGASVAFGLYVIYRFATLD